MASSLLLPLHPVLPFLMLHRTGGLLLPVLPFFLQIHRQCGLLLPVRLLLLELWQLRAMFLSMLPMLLQIRLQGGFLLGMAIRVRVPDTRRVPDPTGTGTGTIFYSWVTPVPDPN
jgi:hypothetical protein